MIIASAVKNVPHIANFDRLAQERYAAIDLGQLLVNMYDTAPVAVLEILAGQLDMLGYNGWILAEDETEQRELLKGAVSLKKMLGTPGGIREVVQRLGFTNIVIEEGWENFTDGSEEPAENSWAYFRVKYVLPNNKAITPQIATDLIGLINNYKNARSVLANFSFGIPQQDTMGLRGEVTLRIRDASTNAILEETTQSNLIVTTGKYWLAYSAGALSYSMGIHNPAMRIERVRFSSHSGAPAVSDTIDMFSVAFEKDLDLEPVDGVIRHTVVQNGDGSNMYLRHWFSLAASEGNGNTIRTLCLIMKDANTTDAVPNALFARILRAPITKTSAIKLEGTWDIHFEANI